jgi:hypothetical protein
LAFVKPIRVRTTTCRSCGGTFEAKRWMVLASWTSCFALLSLVLSLALVIACPLVCWLVGWQWWIVLTVAGALIVPLVKIGGRLGTMRRPSRCLGSAGLLASVALDLVGRCNGELPLHVLLNDLARTLGQPRADIAPACLEVVRRLVEQGFLLPLQ